ncbi:hypothetical protein BDW74DRAFT_140316 [Aspergillus multicolor]|uniref:uncharacterized protein n=1 Tax=Aspergillus multicolor TaxID=41759 RepID=UPI003CCCDEC1
MSHAGLWLRCTEWGKTLLLIILFVTFGQYFYPILVFSVSFFFFSLFATVIFLFLLSSSNSNKKMGFRSSSFCRAALHIPRFLYYIFGTVGTTSMQTTGLARRMGKSARIH